MTITGPNLMHLAESVRRHRPGINNFPGAGLLEHQLLQHEWRTESLAEPPAGSLLRPVYGDAGLPLLGHTFEVMRHGPDFVRGRYDRYGPVSWMSFLGVRAVSALGPDATGEVLINRDKAYAQTGWEYFIRPFFNRGLMLLSFDEHHYHRRIMQEAFTRPRLAGYLSRMDEIIALRVRQLPADGDPLLMYPALKQLTLDVATVVFMAAKPGMDSDRLNKYFTNAVRGGTAVLRFPVPGLRWSNGLEGRRELEKYFRSNLAAKRASDGDDLYSALCHARTDEGHRFSDDDVVNHMIFLMMAAHDTTTITTTAVSYHLAKHPEWQEKVRAEFDALGDGPATIADLETLKTMDLVISESLRLVAPVPSMFRQTVADTDLLGHFVPADTIVAVDPWHNHYMPEYWTEPNRFDPDRFSPERREDKRHRFAYLPFGGGAHRCIGMNFGTMEIKTLMRYLLRHYRLEIEPGYQLSWNLTSLPFPDDGFPVRLRRLDR